jgi:hypothetical protein
MAKDELPELPEKPYQSVQSDGGTTWIEITSVGTEDEARLVQGFLDAEGIPAQIESLKFSMEPINFGAMGDIRIYVSSVDEQRAKELMRQRDVAYDKLDDDDETLVTDEGQANIAEDAEAEPEDENEPA